MDYIRKNSNYSVVAACIAVMFYYGCRSAEEFPEKVFSQFPATYTLEGTAVNPGFPVTHGFLDIYGSYIVLYIHSMDQKDRVIHLYDKNSLEHIASAGEYGRGPGEIVSPGGNISVDKTTGDIFLLDVGKGAMLIFNVDSILKGRQTYTSTIKAPPPPVWVLNFSAHDGGFYFNNLLDPENFLTFLNKDGTIIDSLSIADYEDLYNKREVPELLRINFEMISYFHAIKPDMQRAAIVYRHSDILKVTDMQGNLIRRTTGPDRIPLENLSSDNKVFAYMEVKADSNYIYARYRNMPFYDEDGEPIVAVGIIHVFDWDGNPVCRMQTDYGFSGFVIDSENSQLITFEPVEGDFVWYSLPEF